MASNVELGRESFLDSQSSIPTQERKSGTELHSHAECSGEATLSVAQERLWCLDQFATGKPINNIATVLEITGAFDVGALERAAAQYVQQHAILRTVVENREGRPMARLLSVSQVNIPVSDLTEFPASERERKAMRIAEAAARDLFNVSTGPLLRFQVLRLGPEVHWLVVTAHRIVLDESSMATVHRELAGAYSATGEGRARPSRAGLHRRKRDIRRSKISNTGRENSRGEFLRLICRRIVRACRCKLTTGRPSRCGCPAK